MVYFMTLPGCRDPSKASSQPWAPSFRLPHDRQKYSIRLTSQRRPHKYCGAAQREKSVTETIPVLGFHKGGTRAALPSAAESPWNEIAAKRRASRKIKGIAILRP